MPKLTNQQDSQSKSRRSVEELQIAGAKLDLPRVEGDKLILRVYDTILSNSHPANPLSGRKWCTVAVGELVLNDVSKSTRLVSRKTDLGTWDTPLPVTDIIRPPDEKGISRNIIEWEAAFMTDGSAVSNWRIEYGTAQFTIIKSGAAQGHESAIGMAPRKTLADSQFTRLPSPEGLVYVPGFLSEQESQLFKECVDGETWEPMGQRRILQYGHVYHRGTEKVSEIVPTRPMPSWCRLLAQKIVNHEGWSAFPDQVIINEYQPGQGIGRHVDDPELFGPSVAVVSLGGPALLEFSRADSTDHNRYSILLEPGSLLVLSGEARYGWRHEIKRRSSDRLGDLLHQRGRRISITFRTMRHPKGGE